MLDKAQYHIEKAIDFEGMAPGICRGLVAMAYAFLGDKENAQKYAEQAVNRSGRAPGICHGLAAITYAILASAE